MIAFRSSEAPEVSIVVLLTREPELVRPSLVALARSLPDHLATEVVLVLNTTHASTRGLITDGVRGARVITSPANCGTAVGWNVAFAAARAPHVALMHEDTHPRPGWIEDLLETARASRRALVVTNRILNTDGSTWNAGWIVWRDGWTTTLDDRTAPDLMVADEPCLVDSASSASMLVDRAAFLNVGGFDERTFPTVTTNVDLALAGWRLGHTVVATTRSTVVHATHAMVHGQRGLYSSLLFREFLIRRATRRLCGKWADVLEAGYGPRGDADPTGDRAAHDRARAVTAARAALAPPAAPLPSLQSRHLSAPGGGWPTELDAAAGARLIEAQREVDAEFDAWVLDDREQLRARILELDAGARAASQAHDNAIEELRIVSAERDGLRSRVEELDESARDAARAHANALVRAEELQRRLAARRAERA